MIHFLYNRFLTKKKTAMFFLGEKWLRWQLYKFLKIRLNSYYQNLSLKPSKEVPNIDLVVSLTSFPERMHTVHLSIKSILAQTQRPTKIILWLGEAQFPEKEHNLPQTLLDLKVFGLDIKFCQDLKPHTKYFYAFKAYPDKLIVTIDDDLFYPNTMLEHLMKHYIKNPKCVIANRVREIGIEDGVFKKYRTWPINRVVHSNPSHKLLATGVGGVLYNPALFSDNLFEIEHIKELAPKADDIWLKANEVINEIPVVFTNYFCFPLIEIPNSQTRSLYAENVFEEGNDIQIKRTFDFFGITEKTFE